VAPAAEPAPYNPVTPPDQWIGEMVGSFKLVKLLGKGGMGAVFLGEHPEIGSRVAIKMLHPMLATRPELVKRFYDEARAVNLIGHDNIVSIFDLNQLSPNRYYIVMEALEGQTLASLLAEGPMAFEVAREILLQLCDALAAAHARSIVHRDLKPENVFLTRRGANAHFVKLVDFGIAKLRDETGASNQTATGVLVGTPEYMSPEQADNLPVDARSDIYALGCMAYRMTAGRLPFQESSIGRLIAAHLDRAPPSPREFNPDIPPALEAALLRALAKRPDDRFQSVEDFAAALRHAFDAPAEPAAAPVIPAVAAVAPPPVQQAEQERPVQQAEQERVVADFEVELRQPPPATKLRANDVSRGGLFLCAAPPHPPLFSRVVLALPGAQGMEVEVAGEVVRHISVDEARAWRMSPGFGVQFTGLSPAQREVLEALTVQRPAAALSPPVPEAAVAAAPQVAAVLAYLTERFNASHYDLLGVEPSADGKQISAAAMALEVRIREALERASAEHAPPLEAGRARVRAALETLAHGVRRLEYDARRGNYAGVARAIEGGVPLAEIAGRHQAFLAQRPGLDSRSAQMLGRIKVARNRGNYEAGLREVEVALGQDPLNVDLHRAWQELLRLHKPA